MARQQDKTLLSNSISEMARMLVEAMNLVPILQGRLIISDAFLPDHPEREDMVAYLQARAWKGTDAGSCYVAGIPRDKLEEWRKIAEFRQWETWAEEACTDLAEEMLLLQGYLGGEKDALARALKARRSAKYNERQEITGKGGGPIEVISLVPRPQKVD